MSKTPLVDSLNIPTFKIATRDGWEDATLIKDVEAVLEKLPVVEGKITYLGNDTQTFKRFEIVDKPHCTHTARLFGVQEIKREPVKMEFEAEAKTYGNDVGHFKTYSMIKLPQDVEQGTRFRVTVEEIEG